MAHDSELGPGIRRHRLDLGIPQTRLASQVGVSASLVGQWERGRRVPGPDHVRALIEALDVDPETADAWLELVEPGAPPAIVEDELLAPPLTASEDGLESEMWAESEADAPAPGPPETEDDPAGGHCRRETRGTERGGRRRFRPALPAFLGGTRRPEGEPESEERRRRRRVKLPARVGAVNTGSVFPVPDARRGPQRVTYRSDGITAPGRDRFTYRRRIAQTIVVLVVLAVILWWAFGALGDGLGAVLDLFRGEPDPVPTTEALGVVRPG